VIPDLPEGVEQEERSTGAVFNVRRVAELWDVVQRFSSFRRLIRVTARVIRAVALFRRRAGREDFPMELSPQELEVAKKFWIGRVQGAYFPAEIRQLTDREAIPKSSPLFRLRPFLGDDGLLRLGGRLELSPLEYSAKHPLILPRSSELTLLLIADFHERTLHGGVQLTLSSLRQDYWVIGGRHPVRSFILKCVKCARVRGQLASQAMGQLPSLRVAPARPFLHSGVDYAGPFIRGHGRGGLQSNIRLIL